MREFRDEKGRDWRAWEVRPESIHPQTKSEDYLAACFRDGWLVFETVDATEKRRLCPPPYAWEQRPDEELERLAERAEVLRPLGRKRARAAHPPDLPPSIPRDVAATLPRDEDGNLDIRYLGVVRTFHYPGGELWRAQIVTHDDSNAAPVLRFASETHVVDLTEWPADWMDMSNGDLAELLRIGESIRERRQEDAPKRRHDDRRPDA